jgi:uncharacterized protein YukE
VVETRVASPHPPLLGSEAEVSGPTAAHQVAQVTQQTIPNGEVRTIAGQSVYGSVVSGGDFISADGTLLQLPGGFTEHGKSLPDGTFLAEKTVGGQQLWGNYGDDGSFLSQDGTAYVAAGSNTPETGITTPDGTFLPGGSTRTLPNGTVLYGFDDNGTFYTANGNTLVFPDGTTVNGTYDQNTGIFLGNNGSDFFIGQNGVVPVTPQPDGSFKEPDGSVIMTAKSWSIDLPAFQDAIGVVKSQTDQISTSYQQIQSWYSTLALAWVSPAGTSFENFEKTINSAMTQLNSALETVIQAMHSSYNNYVQAEQAATANLSGS